MWGSHRITLAVATGAARHPYRRRGGARTRASTHALAGGFKAVTTAASTIPENADVNP